MVSILSSTLNELPDFLINDPDFTVVKTVDEKSPYLFMKEGRLTLMTPATRQEGFSPLSMDFLGPWKYHLRQNYSLKREPLAKALGHKFSLVWDITCGTGADSVLLLFFGAKVVAFERNPIIWALLEDALGRARRDPHFGHHFRDRFTLVKGDPRDYSYDEKPQAIYYDPMYPPGKGKALPRKEMRIIREVVGDDPDLKQIMAWAQGLVHSRFIVKRPSHAQDLAEKPGHSYRGKSTRYDVYFR